MDHSAEVAQAHAFQPVHHDIEGRALVADRQNTLAEEEVAKSTGAWPPAPGTSLIRGEDQSLTPRVDRGHTPLPIFE